MKKSPLLRWRDEFQRLHLYSKGPCNRNEEGPVYIFHHLPKCGGTSVRHALRGWFHVLNDYRYNVENEMPSAVCFEKLPSDCCICGHFPPPLFSLEKRYPDLISDERYRVFTFIRHPLDLKLSLYKYEKDRGCRKARLEEHLFDRPNYLAARLQVENASQIPHVLNRYFFIGQLECLQDSFDLLALRINKDPVQMPRRNVSSNLEEGLSQATIQEFERANSLDYQIYEYVTQSNLKSV